MDSADAPRPVPGPALDHDRAAGSGAARTEAFAYDGLPVPYITRWSGEPIGHPDLTTARGSHGHFLAYADEHAVADRHWRGPLIARQPIARGRGTAELRDVHVRRQLRCMRDMLCQICARRVEGVRDDSFLFLFRGVRPIPDGHLTTVPPVCGDECAGTALRSCPYLARGHTAVRARHVLPWGIAGILHDQATLAKSSDRLVWIPFDSERVRWAVAHRAVVSLHGVTPVAIRAEGP
ncbi:hypothetical protein ACWC5I_44570 [Kitasatospora sp. NPDC001574]